MASGVGESFSPAVYESGFALANQSSDGQFIRPPVGEQTWRFCRYRVVLMLMLKLRLYWTAQQWKRRGIGTADAGRGTVPANFEICVMQTEKVSISTACSTKISIVSDRALMPDSLLRRKVICEITKYHQRKVAPERIADVNWIAEGYEHLALVSTIDQEGIHSLRGTPDTYNDVLEIVERPCRFQ